MTNQLAHLYLSLTDFADPLLKHLSGMESLERLFFRYGWNINLNDQVWARLNQVLTVRTALQNFVAAAGAIRARLDADPEASITAAEIATLAQKAAPLIKAIAQLSPNDLTGLPEPLNQPAFWNDVAGQMMDDLLEQYLRIYQPAAYLVLHVWGVIRYQQEQPAGPHRRPFVRTVIDWAHAIDAVKDPAGTLAATYKWGDATAEFDHKRFLQALENVLRALRVPAHRNCPDPGVIAGVPAGAGYRPKVDTEGLRLDLLYGVAMADQVLYQVGLDLMPAVRTGETKVTGVMARPTLRGAAAKTLPLTDDIAVKCTGAIDASNALFLGLFPDEVDFSGGQAQMQAAVEVFSTRTDPWYLLGGPKSARIEVNGFSAGLSLSGTPADPEARLHLKTQGANGSPGCRVVIPLDEADGFVKESVQENAIELSLSPELMWSSKTGLTFNGAPTISVDVPLSKKIGPFTIRNARIALTDGGENNGSSSLLLRADAGINGTLGPFQVAIERIGLACRITPHSRESLQSLPAGTNPPVLGNLDVSLQFAPPQGIGLAVEAQGVVGGGYLFFDPQKEEYAGILQLEIADTIAVSAVGLLTTRMPDGSSGFSLVICVTAQGFQPIQLGFGFRLTGIGGLVGVNRTASVDALRSGLKNKTLDSILFPQDPVSNAGQIVSAMRTVFPPAAGRFVFGPMAIIDWAGVITMELAVLLEVPSPVRLMVLGQIQACLPKKDKAVVKINMDVLGVVEFDKGELAIDAVLYDSRILTFPISGEMALRARWQNNPTFIMAAGGFNPSFRAPEGFPALKRLAVALTTGDNPRLRLEAYVALTSNTAQIGARLDLRVAVSSFSVEGYLQFDALFQFSPFQFTADMAAGVALKWDGRTLLGVQLQLTLSGPTHWHARGSATFKIWVFSKTVSFDKTFGPQQAPVVLPPSNPLPELLTALNDRRNWGGALPDGARGLVILRETPTTAELMVHPLGQIGVRQRVAPLDTDISKFGNTAPVGERRFSITHAQLGSQQLDESRKHKLTDYFAPAQFLELTEAQSLSRPSFERMNSGIELGTDIVAFGGSADAGLMTVATAKFETVIVSPSGAFSKPKSTTIIAKTTIIATSAIGTAARTAARPAGAGRYRSLQHDVSPRDPQYAVANADDLTPASGVQATGYTEAEQALARKIAANRSLRGKLRVADRSEVTGVTA